MSGRQILESLLLSYPRGKLVGFLKFGNALPPWEFSDKNGNVFINGGVIAEYVRGGKKPIQTFTTPATSLRYDDWHA
jgi:hypothetical protein